MQPADQTLEIDKPKFIKNCTKHSSNILLSLVRFFMTQSLALHLFRTLEYLVIAFTSNTTSYIHVHIFLNTPFYYPLYKKPIL